MPRDIDNIKMAAISEKVTRTFEEIGRIKQELKDPNKEREFFSLAFTKSGEIVAADNCPNEQVKSFCVFKQNGEFDRVIESPDYLFIAGIAVTEEENYILIDFSSNCVIVFPPVEGRKNNHLFADKPLCGPNAVVFHNDLAFVTESKGDQVSVLSKEGKFKYRFGSKGSQPAQFNWPQKLCVGPDELLYITDMKNNRVQVFTQEGEFVREFGHNVLKRPLGIAATNEGYIVVASGDANKLSFFSTNGRCVHEILDAGLDYPIDVKVGRDGFIYVADSGNHRIVKF